MYKEGYTKKKKKKKDLIKLPPSSLSSYCYLVLYLCFAVHKPIFLPSLNSSLIGPGDLCGEELLTWALDPCSSVPPFQHARLLPSLKLKPLLSFPRT
jgi:cyclic nucleotide gated channel